MVSEAPVMIRNAARPSARQGTWSLREMRVSAARWSAVKSAANKKPPAALMATVEMVSPLPPYLRSCQATGCIIHALHTSKSCCATM